jgi:hypothetical protein
MFFGVLGGIKGRLPTYMPVLRSFPLRFRHFRTSSRPVLRASPACAPDKRVKPEVVADVTVHIQISKVPSPEMIWILLS